MTETRSTSTQTATRSPAHVRTDSELARQIALLAIGAGVAVACLYYIQPVLAQIALELGEPESRVGMIPTATQIGYAIGIFFLVPMGDCVDRKRLIQIKSALLVLALAATALAPGIVTLALAGAAMGVLCSIAQDFVPFAAQIAPPEKRGRVVGLVMTGLLSGILLSRTLSGLISEHFGWRTVYWAAAVTVVLLTLAVQRWLPRMPLSVSASYPQVLKSLVTLARRYAPLRKSALTQMLISASFSAFWSTLAYGLHAPPFQFGPGAIGAFGIAGAVGALAAPVVGHLADRYGAALAMRSGIALIIVSFAAMALQPESLAVLIVATVLFDLGVQSSLISNQAIIYALDPNARSRLNAVFFTTVFIGMASGAALGTWVFTAYGWVGVCTLGAGLSSLAMLRTLLR